MLAGRPGIETLCVETRQDANASPQLSYLAIKAKKVRDVVASSLASAQSDSFWKQLFNNRPVAFRPHERHQADKLLAPIVMILRELTQAAARLWAADTGPE